MKTLLILLLINLATIVFSQHQGYKDKKLDLEVGINFNRLKTVELGVNLTKDMDGVSTLSTNAIILSSEFGSTNTNQFLYAPKLTYAYYFFIYNGSVSLINFNYNNNATLYFNPQIGISLFGLADLVYGYNFPIIDKNRMFDGNSLTLRCRILGMRNFIK